MSHSTLIEVAAGAPVSRETVDRLGRLAAMVVEESANQNLIAAGSVPLIWDRHIADSVQLLRYGSTGPWVDLGTGAGFPGLALAACGVSPMTLVESRRLRHEFLERAVAALGLSATTTIFGGRIETLPTTSFAVISARAFAPLDRLLTLAERFSTENTRWILPKGRSAREELASVRKAWHGDFRLEPSMTDPESVIIVADGVRRRAAR